MNTPRIIGEFAKEIIDSLCSAGDVTIHWAAHRQVQITVTTREQQESDRRSCTICVTERQVIDLRMQMDGLVQDVSEMCREKLQRLAREKR